MFWSILWHVTGVFRWIKCVFERKKCIEDWSDDSFASEQVSWNGSMLWNILLYVMAVFKWIKLLLEIYYTETFHIFCLNVKTYVENEHTIYKGSMLDLEWYSKMFSVANFAWSGKIREKMWLEIYCAGILVFDIFY